MLRKEKWRRGVGSTLYGVFIMLLCTTMCLFFVQTVKVQQEFQDTQLAADSIAEHQPSMHPMKAPRMRNSCLCSGCTE